MHPTPTLLPIPSFVLRKDAEDRVADWGCIFFNTRRARGSGSFTLQLAVKMAPDRLRDASGLQQHDYARRHRVRGLASKSRRGGG